MCEIILCMWLVWPLIALQIGMWAVGNFNALVGDGQPSDVCQSALSLQRRRSHARPVLDGLHWDAISTVTKYLPDSTWAEVKL